jgi:hypothetical protein
MAVQERSGELIHDWLVAGGSEDTLLDQLDDLYRASDPAGKELAPGPRFP